MLHCILVPSSLTTPVPVAAARHAGIQKEYTAASCLDSEKGGSGVDEAMPTSKP
uniref:Uncharacterized protein n=1 Tax=Setaria italica TaxID=4555 RepID=K3ZPG6_SETIT